MDELYFGVFGLIPQWLVIWIGDVELERDVNDILIFYLPQKFFDLLAKVLEKCLASDRVKYLNFTSFCSLAFLLRMRFGSVGQKAKDV